MKIAIACDHGGFERKEQVKNFLMGKGYEVEDFGTHNTESCHYPVFGEAAANAVASGACEKGIVICTTGIGMSIVANKVKGIRCAHCTDLHTAEMTRHHNDSNMLAIGAALSDEALSCQMAEVFLTTEFDGGRHQTRVDMITAIEEKN